MEGGENFFKGRGLFPFILGAFSAESALNKADSTIPPPLNHFKVAPVSILAKRVFYRAIEIEKCVYF